jgi:hypothetical protein
MPRDVVHEVRHAISPDDLRRVLEKDRIGQGTCREERATRAEHHGNKIDDDLVDEAEPQCLTSDLATGDIDDPVAGVLPSGTDGRLDAVDERERRCVGVLPVRRRFVGDHNDVLAAAGLPSQPFVRSNSRRPMTTTAISA